MEKSGLYGGLFERFEILDSLSPKTGRHSFLNNVDQHRNVDLR